MKSLRFLLPTLALFLGLWSIPQAPAQVATTETVPDVVQGITDRELGGHLRFLASDLMKGRDTASPEIRIAAEYLAAHLQGAGAEPAGDREGNNTSYFARFPLELTTPRVEGTNFSLILEQDGARRELPFELHADFVLMPRGVAIGEVEAPVVFAGYGRASDDDDGDYEGLDVKNRFVLILDGEPPAQNGDGQRSRRPLRGSNPIAKRDTAAKRGALGLLVVHPFGNEARPYNESQGMARRLFDRQAMSLGATRITPPLLYLEDVIRDAMDEQAGLSGEDSAPRELEGVRARLSFAADREVVHDRNVIGLFPGSDPEKRHEVIVYSAHYDHVGVNDAGEIFNGSDDNASGTSALLEIAQAFGDGPRPARTVAFLWVSGEEKGLLGSRWWTEHQTLPDDYEIVANINIDMISRNDPNQIFLTPSPDHSDYSSLVTAAVDACEIEAIEPVFEADQFFNRTDSANFARLGIPVVFFFSGVHEDYHQPSDTVDKADLGKAARIARVAYRLGWTIAQAEEAPKKIKAEAEAAVAAEAEAQPGSPTESEPAGTGAAEQH